jgi:hypothetical protein
LQQEKGLSSSSHHVNSQSACRALSGLAGAKVELSTITAKHSTPFFETIFREYAQSADNER